MDILQNPFHLLNASPRDNRRRIMELADERSLLLDSSQCMEARSELTNPRKRLSAEVAWLPGIGPKRAAELLSLIESSPRDLLAVDNVSSIARANLLAAGLARLPDRDADNVAEWILEIAWAFEDIDPNKLRVIINEERIVSGFPEVSDLFAVEAEIQERRRHYRQVIKSALDNLVPKKLVQAVTDAVESATDGGEEHGPILIADLVDSYEVEAKRWFLDKEEGNIRSLVEKLRAAVDAERSDSTLAPMVNQLIRMVKNWDTVAQPIQVSAKSRGLDHVASHDVAGLIRGLAIHMFNEHEKLDFSQQLTKMLQDVFAEVGELAETASEDADALGDIAERRKLGQLLAPISDLCNAALERSNEQPSIADKEAQKVMYAAPKLILNLSAAKPGAEILSQGKDEIALTLLHCAVVYGNKTKKWKPCIEFLEAALKYAVSKELISRIEKNLSSVRDNDSLDRDFGYGPGVRIALARSVRDNDRLDRDLAPNSFTKHETKTAEGSGFLAIAVISSLFVIFVLCCLFNNLPTKSAFNDVPNKKPEVPRQNIPRKDTPPTSNRRQSNQAEPQAETGQLAMPATGIMQSYDSTDAVAPLEIRTRFGSGNYYVKISRIVGGRLILSRTAFIRDGGTLETQMPLGDYEIRYANGENWYGTERLFGKRTSYSKADEVFRFQKESDGISGFTIELYKQVNGNLRTDPLTAGEF
jgi:hypothetical protein